MNKLVLAVLFSMAFFTASSQKLYFVYLQSESDQPFLVKMGDKNFSSSASGYLILSKLRDSTYDLAIAFPQNKWPEQHYILAVNGKDHGYQLKNFGSNGWGLFDMQTLAVQMPAGVVRKDESAPDRKDVSTFTDILSKASGDPTLKENSVQQPVKEEKKPDPPTQQLVKKDEPKKEENKPVATDPVVVKKEETKTIVNNPPVVKKEDTKTITAPAVVKKEDKPAVIKEETQQPKETVMVTTEPYRQSVVTKKSESSTTGGFGLVFIDDYGNGKKDTIRIMIPNPKPTGKTVNEEPKDNKKFLDISSDTSASSTVAKTSNTVVQPVSDKTAEKPVEKPAEKAVGNIKCREQAAEADFLQVRKAMAAETTDDDMVLAAKKYFKAKCFTVAQVKNLGVLFLDDEGKYKFFDAVYSAVSDTENFAGLQNELKDSYYINRFKAMLRE